MAITFLEKRKRLKYLFPILIVLSLITVIVIWWGFFKKEKPLPIEEIEVVSPKKVKIDFQVLKNPLLEKLQPFPTIPPFKEKVGRENPFMSYE